jgi:hypothetical protein
MNPMNRNLNTALLTTLLLGFGPIAQAQSSALFTDGTAFGGSKVFSEGLNPLGNPARFNLTRPYCPVLPGCYLTFTDGRQESQDFWKGLDDLKLNDQAKTTEGLTLLEKSPWALKTRAYGLGFMADNGHFSYTREETTSLWANADALPEHLGSASNLLLNGTSMDARRTLVDRVAWGMTGAGTGYSMGTTFRVERWSLGSRTFAVNPLGEQTLLLGPDVDPIGFRKAAQKTYTGTIDLGFTFELIQGIQFGATVDRLLPKRIWDVEEKAQARAGLQIDIGSMAKLIAETDLNKVERMPFPMKQHTSALSLVINANPSLSIALGAERRTIGDVKVTRGGVTLRVHTPSLTIGAGIQLGQDQPLKGGTLLLR